MAYVGRALLLKMNSAVAVEFFINVILDSLLFYSILCHFTVDQMQLSSSMSLMILSAISLSFTEKAILKVPSFNCEFVYFSCKLYHFLSYIEARWFAAYTFKIVMSSW